MPCVTRNDFKAATESATTLKGIFSAVTFWLQSPVPIIIGAP